MESYLIAFATIMFVFSQISERICNFLKLYLPESIFGNLINHESDPVMEKKREKKIFLLSWGAGCFTALLVYLLLKDINSASPLSFLNSYKNYVWFYFGTSIFLSFGSKFWHDILDILFLYKNSKRVLEDPDTYMVGRTEEISIRLAQTQSDIIRGAWAEQKAKLQSIKGVVAVAIGYPKNADPVLRVYVKDEVAAGKIPREVLWVDNGGTAHHVKIEINISGLVLAQFGHTGLIYNAATSEKNGTLGYFFQDKHTSERYILSCYHVMRSSHPWNYFRALGNAETIRIGSSRVARLVFGCRNDLLDVAIATIDADFPIRIDGIEPMKSSAHVDYTWVGIPIKIAGGMSAELINGSIYEPVVESVTVEYDDGSYLFRNFFSICLDNGSSDLQCPTQPGDSGALVYHAKTQKALGIIVGGSKRLAYAMKIPVIEEQLGIEIIT